MKIEIFINGAKYFSQADTFSKSFLNVIEDSIRHNQNQELHQTKANEIKTLVDICIKDNLVFHMGRQITLDVDFATKLRIFDTINCTCLKPITELGETVKELMIDNYQLILMRRAWMEPDHLKLDFEAVDYGEAWSFLPQMMKGNF